MTFAMPALTHRRIHRWKRGLLAGLACAGLAGIAQGQVDADKPAGAGGLRVSGFGSLGVSHVDAPAGWGYRRELTQGGSDASWRSDIDTRLGVQLNYSLGSQFELVAQAIAKKRGAYAVDGDALEWAYASYRPNGDWTLRTGRVNLDVFLMADYRNVGYGFLTARPPVEFYAMLPTALDGADVARSWIQGDAQWRAKLMLGSARIGDIDGAKASRVRSVVGAMLSREEGGLLLRASYAHTHVDIDRSNIQPVLDGLAQLGSLPIPVVAGQAQMLRRRLGADGGTGTFWELGLRHELADWQWSAEFVRISADPLIVLTSAYATLGRRVGDWTPYIGYGQVRDSQGVLAMPAWEATLAPVIGPAGAAQAQMLGSAVTASLNGSRFQQSSWSLGARWDFHPQAALKVQWDRVRVSESSSGLWTGANGVPSHADIATVVVDFIF